MKIISILILLIGLANCDSTAQDIQCRNIDKRDSILFNNFKEYSKSTKEKTLQETAMFFLNTPYKGGTLDINNKESLVINLKELDCLTYIENTISLYLCQKEKNLSLNNFSKKIKYIRYRNGQLNSYTSRLHYSLDWIHNNIKKGIIRDISKEMEGEPFNNVVDFMSTHSSSYKALKNKNFLKKIKNIEEKINLRHYFHIPKNKVKDVEEKINNFDIIFITTNIKGLDINHVGFAIKMTDGIHLVHASSTNKKVLISEKNLHNYLSNIKKDIGIIVCRLK